ncbi:MAG TPA: DUF86 domain-containing protein [Leptospiraceae bacterium]|nr:DUF86 domain-containing protein [Leptospiraceae bacterium]
MNRDKASIEDIIHSSKLIMEFLNGVSFENYVKDIKLISAVERQLEIMGEAVKRLSKEIRNSFPDIEWKQIAGLRDMISHGYDVIDQKEIWNICNSSVPNLLPKVEEIFKSL